MKQGSKHLSKLENRSTPMVFVGYEPGSKAWRFYNLATGHVHVSRDAIFEEDRPWNWGDTGSRGSEPDIEDIFRVEHIVFDETEKPGGETVVPGSTATTPALYSPPRTPPGVVNPAQEPRSVNLDKDHDDAPPKFRLLEDILGSLAPSSHEDQNLIEQLMLSLHEELATVEEAKSSEAWRKAMLEEMISIEENKTWSLVSLPKGHRSIGLKWVFKLKRDEHGTVVKQKARLVAKGYVQRQGVDFEEVFAPDARMESVRLVLAVAAHCGWPVHQMDVKSTFLNGELAEEVLCSQLKDMKGRS